MIVIRAARMTKVNAAETGKIKELGMQLAGDYRDPVDQAAASFHSPSKILDVRLRAASPELSSAQ